MKTLNIPFDDEEFKKLLKAKREYEKILKEKVSWGCFILENLT